MKRNRWSSVPLAAAVDSVAAVAVPAESAIAGKQLTLIEQAKGCHESMAPLFLSVFRGYEEALYQWRRHLLPNNFWPATNPSTSVTKKIPKKIKNSTFAISAASAAMPP